MNVTVQTRVICPSARQVAWPGYDDVIPHQQSQTASWGSIPISIYLLAATQNGPAKNLAGPLVTAPCCESVGAHHVHRVGAVTRSNHSPAVRRRAIRCERRAHRRSRGADAGSTGQAVSATHRDPPCCTGCARATATRAAHRDDRGSCDAATGCTSVALVALDTLRTCRTCGTDCTGVTLRTSDR